MGRSHHLALAAAALLGCGGAPPEPRPDVAAAVEPDHLAVAWNVEDTPGYPERLYLTASEPVQVSLDENADFSLTGVDALQGGAGYMAGLDLMPAQPSARGPGVHEGELHLRVRAQRGGRWVETARSPLAIPYAYTVRKPALVVTPASLVVSTVIHQPVERTLELDGREGEGPWSIAVSGGGASVDPASGSSLPATVKVTFEAALVGRDSGAIVVRRGANDVRVPTQVEVTPAPLSYAGPPIELTWLHGRPGSPPPVTVALGTATGEATSYSAKLVEQGAPDRVLPFDHASGGTAPGTFSFSFDPARLWPAEYVGKLVLQPLPFGPTLEIPVKLHLTPGAFSFPPAGGVLQVSPYTTAAQAEQSIEVTANGTGVGLSAVSDAAWLEVSPSSGVPSPRLTLTARMNPAALPRVEQAVLTATVAVSWTEPDGTPVVRHLPFVGTVSFPAAGWVEPPAVAAGPVTVEVPGASSPCASPATVVFGDLPAIAASCPWPGLLRVTPPALPAGTYPVWISNALGVRRESGATLTVLAPAARVAASWPSPGPASRLFLDERTGSLFSVHPSAGKLVRHREPDGWAEDVLDLPGLDDAVLRGGGDRLVAMTSAGVFLVDPASLATRQAYAWSPGAPGAGWSWTLAPAPGGLTLAFAADSGCTSPCSPLLLFPHLPPGILWLGDVPSAYPGSGAASGDLGSAVAVRHQPASPPPIWTFDPDTNAASASASGTSVSVDRTGSRVLVLDQGVGGTASRLFGAGFVEVPGVLPTSTAAAVLSPDGGRAYTFDAATRKVRTFDLVGPPETGAFVETGAAQTPMADPGDGVAIALTADARTVLLAGDAHVVLVPLP